jgi:hypothetical protein
MLSLLILAGASWFLMDTAPQVVLVSNSPEAAQGQCQEEIVPSLLKADWSHKGHEIVFIDEAVEHIEMLLPELAQYEVLIIERDSDGVQQISDALLARDGLSGLHIISHGGSGSLLLGNGYLSMATLSHYADSLALWGQSLSQDADILLYGCGIASGQTGQAFIEQLSTLTGADIAASDDLTGSTRQGGDWQLEVTQGDLDTQALALPRNYPSVLDYVIEQLEDNSTYIVSGNGQSFLTIGPGEINEITIYTENAVSACSLTIYQGESLDSANKLGEQSAVNLKTGENSITLNTPVAVQANSKYTFYFSACSNDFIIIYEINSKYIDGKGVEGDVSFVTL